MCFFIIPVSVPEVVAVIPKGAKTFLNTNFSYHLNESSTLQLINSISNGLQILLKYFNGTTIFTSLFLFAPSASVLPIRFDLRLKDENCCLSN